MLRTFMSTEPRQSFLEYRKLVQRIREEFEEMPRLRFTVNEAARFWAIDEVTCESVLMQLAAAGFLARGTDCRFEMYRQA
jgi:Fic family protein